MLKLSYSDPETAKKTTFLLAFCVTTVPILLTVVFSSHIVVAAHLRIPQLQESNKFSPRAPPTSVLWTLATVYAIPTATQATALHSILSLLCTVVTLMINPIVYTLKNKDVTKAVRRLVSQWAYAKGT